MGLLFRGIDTLGLTDRTTYVMVSDHGMAPTSGDRLIFLDDYVNPGEIEVVDWTPNLAVNPRGNTAPDALYRTLVNKHPALAVYTREQFTEGAAVRHERANPDRGRHG